jgi:hypothetical protein
MFISIFSSFFRKVIQPLKQDIIQLEDKITETDMRTDDLEQYGRRHSLRISVIPESHKEHTDMLICEFLKNELNIEINMGNIDRSHRVGQKKPNLNRPIAVRFINYRLKNTYMLIECTLKRVIILMNHYPKEDLVYSIMLDN